MKAKSFYKNNKHNNMDSKEKENINEEELKAQDAQDETCEETTEKEEEVALTEEEKQVEIVYTIDHTPPQQVKKVRVTDTDGCIGLTWEESGETDIQAYRVYKKNGSSWSRIREAAVLNAYDTDVKPGNSYTYKVSAVDQAGNEGVCSEEITAVAEQDKEQPVVYGLSLIHI